MWKENKYEEAKFHRYFEKNANSSNQKLLRCIWLSSEERLYKATELLKREIYEEEGEKDNKITFGRIDILFRYAGGRYCGEIKYQNKNYDFWESMKIMGYTTYFNWQNNVNGKDPYKPAILMPKNKVKLENRLIANKLRILLLGIEKHGEDDYSLSDTSKWD